MGKYKMAKHFHLDITDHSFRYTRNPDSNARRSRRPLYRSDLDAPGTVA